jgi:malate synthase
VLDRSETPVPEGILDAVVTSLIALHDLKGNTRTYLKIADCCRSAIKG